MLIKIFEKYNLSIDAYNICLRSAPTLPLSLNQPAKHLLLDDLVVTGKRKSYLIDYVIFPSKRKSLGIHSSNAYLYIYK